MSNYQVSLLMTSKQDRKHFNFLKLDYKKYYPIIVIDDFLKHIQEEVETSYQKEVNLRFKLVEVIEIAGSSKKDNIELGEFDFVVKPTTKFLNEDRFYQIAETEIYLKSPNVDENYKQQVLENIKNAKDIKMQNTSDKKLKNSTKKSILGNLFKQKKDSEETIEKSQKDFPGQENVEQEDELNTEHEEQDIKQVANNENKEKLDYDAAFSESVLESEEQMDVQENIPAEKSEETITEQPKVEETDSTYGSDSIDLSAIIDIPDFQLPKVKAKDVFLTQSDDPVENKKLSYLFDRETRLASLKEKRLVNIYSQLVEKYHQYVIANESDIEEKLNDFEESRQAFVEEYTKEIKEQAKKKLNNKIAVTEEKLKAELEDFKEEQRRALIRFEEQLEIDKEEIISTYKEELQNEVKEEKHKADIRFDEDKDKLKEELKQKVKGDVYNYLMIDRKNYIQSLNDEIFKYDEETYKKLDKHLIEWKADLENKNQKLQKQQSEALEQAKYEAEKEKAQAEIIAMKEKDREIELNNQKIKEQELEQRKQENAFKVEEQRLKAREVSATEKANELYKNNNKASWSSKKVGAIIGGSIIAMLVLLLLASQFLFNSKPTYADLIENNQFADAYEEYPNRYNDLLNTAYEERDLETLEYLSSQNEEDQLSDLYLALGTDNTEEVIQSYEAIENKKSLNDDVLKSVADKYLLNQDIEGAKEVNTYISNNDFSEKIAETQNYIEIKKDLERVIEESDDEKEVSDAERDLAQINTLLKVEEDTNNE